MNVMIPLLITICALPAAGYGGQRVLPVKPEIESLDIRFNNETIKGFVLRIDTRTERERASDALRGRPAGPVMVFFQGHAQRPDDAYEFTSRLALTCRSGIVIVPVCDTPYGGDPGLRGDNGKDIVLMEMVRFVLARQGVSVTGYTPMSGMRAVVQGEGRGGGTTEASARLTPVGWSHGAILARRFAHAYPASVCALGQVCPAGYERWGSWGLTGRFALESLRIFKKMGNGHAAGALKSAWGFTRGFAGDFARSLPDAVLELNPAKAGRVLVDVRDCCTYCDSASFRAAHLERIAVIFGADDTCMDPARQLGIRDISNVTPEELSRFRKTFFADVTEPKRLSLKILPGTHMAPVSHAGIYVRTLLKDLGEVDDD